MRKNSFHLNNYAVSEIVGGLLLLVMAILAFAAIYNFVFPLPDSDVNSNVKIAGYVASDGSIILEHIGGEVLTSYRIDVRDKNNNLLGSNSYSNQVDWFGIGETIVPISNKLVDEKDSMHVLVISMEDDEEIIFNGILHGLPKTVMNVNQSELSILISSLFTDTSCEDLIFNNHSLEPEIEANTYIINWFVDGNSIYELLMPFDTNNSISTKDYSGNNLDGAISSAEWINSSNNNGAYYFDGSSSYISMQCPDILKNISGKDFTISFLVKSYDPQEDHRLILEGGGKKDFIKIFQFGNEIHAGLYIDGVKRAVRTEEISNFTWYHIAVVWNSFEEELQIYCDGILSDEPGYRTFSQGVKEALEIGHGTASSRFFYGEFDQLEIYNRVLSEEQIYQDFLCSLGNLEHQKVIVSEETKTNDVWYCIITPNNGIIDGNPIVSNYLQIINCGEL